MRILYGVVGEGMGHATRSLVVLEHLLQSGHEVRVVVSGRAHQYLVDRLQSYDHVTIDEIQGLTLRYFGNRLDRAGSLFWNLRHAPEAIRRNVGVYRRVAEDGFKPGLVVSDFESWAALYGLKHRLPVVSIDNIQIINRCKHDTSITKGKGLDFGLARMAVKMKVPGAYHYLITSFFFPPVRRRYTTLVPPILRPEVVAASRVPREHVLVYHRAVSRDEIVPMLQKLPYHFRVYGVPGKASAGNVSLCPFSESGFLEDLRTARAAIAGGGFSFMSEAVSLGVPVLAVPIASQFEQELNARYLAALGYGSWAKTLNRELVESFLARTKEFALNLSVYARADNTMTFRCLDELVERCRRGRKRPARLYAPALGKWKGV